MIQNMSEPNRLIMIEGDFPIPSYMSLGVFKKLFDRKLDDTYRARLKELRELIVILHRRLEPGKNQGFILRSADSEELLMKREKGRIVIAEKPDKPALRLV